MDLVGLSDRGLFKHDVNRPLKPGEIAFKLDVVQPEAAQPKDLLSVVKINDTYLEVVDRWYSHKGWGVLYGLFILVVSGIGFSLSIGTFFMVGDWWFFLVVVVLTFLMALLGWVFFRLEAFQLTHYPVRFNRKNRMVYAILPRGRTVRVKWDDLFIFLAKNDVPLMGKPFYEVMAHVLSDDKKTVLETFSLGYPAWGEKSDAYAIWEFVRRYMEEPSGYRKNSELVGLCMPIDNKRESLAFCIVRGMTLISSSPIVPLVLSPVWAVIVWGRMISIYTSKVPVWPADIEAQCHSPKDDPHARTSGDNFELTFIEGTWPIICFCIGSAISLAAIVWGSYEFWSLIQAV